MTSFLGEVRFDVLFRLKPSERISEWLATTRSSETRENLAPPVIPRSIDSKECRKTFDVSAKFLAAPGMTVFQGPFSSLSEQKLDPYLTNSWIARTRHKPKAGTEDVTGWVIELGVVENIEKLATKLQGR